MKISSAITRSTAGKAFFFPFAWGFSFWGVLVYYRMVPQGLVFIHIVFLVLAALAAGGWFRKLVGEERFTAGGWRLVLFAFVALALAANYNTLFFYLLTPVYYPYPPPNLPLLRAASMFAAAAAFAALFLAAGGEAVVYLRNSSQPLRELAKGLTGIAFGNLCANWTVSHSWPLAFFCSCRLLMPVLLEKKLLRFLAFASVLAALIVYFQQGEKVYLGSLQETMLEKKVDSPYARSHFFSFRDRSCVMLASNYHPLNYNCRQPQELPRGLAYLFKALTAGRKEYRALVAGRSLGMYPNLLLAANPNAELIQTAEFDRALCSAVAEEFGALTTPPEWRRLFRYFAGDLSLFLLQQQEKYDLIFFNGIGLSQFQVPFSLPYHEQFLFTDKVLNHLFDKLLPEDGLLIIDWGGRSSDDPHYHLTNFPAGVKKRVFWYVLTDPPFVGSPLYYIIASRSEQRLEQAAQQLKRSTYFKEVTEKITPLPFHFSLWQALENPGDFLRDLWALLAHKKIFTVKFSWHRPFMIYDVVHVQLLLLLFISVVLPILFSYAGALIIAGREQMRFSQRLINSWKSRPRLFRFLPCQRTVLSWAAGFATAAWFIDAVGRQAHQLSGYGYSWYKYALFFLASMAGGLVFNRWRKKIVQRTAEVFFIAAALLLSICDLGAAAATPVLFSGVTTGLAWSRVLAQTSPPPGAFAFEEIFCGIAGGFAVSQFILYFVGFNGLVLAAAAAVCFVLWRRQQKGGGAGAAEGQSVSSSTCGISV